jgi:hypothetical protein
MLFEDVLVEFVFGMGEKDIINNGYLQEFCIKTLEDKTIYNSSEKEGSWINLNLIKEQYKDFLISEYAVHSYNLHFAEHGLKFELMQIRENLPNGGYRLIPCFKL